MEVTEQSGEVLQVQYLAPQVRHIEFIILPEAVHDWV